jgi:hypothetical protein
MALEDVMKVAAPLVGQAEALAVIAAKVKLDGNDADVDPAIREGIDRVVELLGVRENCEALDPRERQIVAGFATAFVRLANDLVDNPTGAGAWQFTDPVILQSIGGGSAVIATMLANAGYAKADARILDVGAGVCMLSIAFCNVFPKSTVVALDPWEPSRKLAHGNIAAFGMQDRITVEPTTIEAYRTDTPFDLLWLPTPFLHPAVLDDAIARVCELAAPDAWVVLGTFGETGIPLADALTDLRTLRSGGTPLPAAVARERMEKAGLVDVRSMPSAPHFPVGLNIGRRA